MSGTNLNCAYFQEKMFLNWCQVPSEISILFRSDYSLMANLYSNPDYNEKILRL
jgi:hypothetical protein